MTPLDKPIRAFSFGGGVQSTATLVLQAQGKIAPYDAFVFANVGDDSENPATLAYIEAVSKPYAAAHGISLIEVRKLTRGQPETLLQHLYRQQRSVPIPAYMQTGAPGRRNCTTEFKIAVVDRWIRQQGYASAVIGLGISMDEYQRMRDTDWHDHYGTKRFGFWKKHEYPLISLRLTRQDALNIISEAGLPPPPKSSCWFCPFSSRSRWIELRRNNPELFAKAVALEETINAKRAEIGRDRVYLHPSLRPLEKAVSEQLPLFPDDGDSTCDSGYCFV